MYRLILGFILGIAAAYYTVVPAVESPFNGFNTAKITQFFQSDELTHTSNTFNATPPSELESLGYQYGVSGKIRNAITLISAHDLDAQTSDYAVNLITDLIVEEPKLQGFVRAQMDNGITNKEALNIFEQYLSLQG